MPRVIYPENIKPEVGGGFLMNDGLERFAEDRVLETGGPMGRMMVMMDE